ncbi:MAG TPA: hypothetical protein VEI97_02455, partial [bacterium]|nr:hypothetical protein [bacterium]
PVGQFRTEAVLPMPYGNAVLLRVASALNTTDPDAVLETLAELGYTAGNLGITTVNGQLRLDQNDLDGTGTLGVAVRVTPILDNGENGEPAWDFGYYFDRRPMKVTNINVAFAPNPDLDEDPEAPPLPLLTWFRLPYPMGSDIVDYGVIRDGPGGRFTYRLGAEDPTAVINEEGVHNNLLTFVDNNDPPIRGNATYFYSIFGIDRALQFGMPSEGILVQPGGPPADPPIVELEVTQGNRDIIPGGQSIIAGGNPPTPVQVDFSGSTADEGRFIVEYRLQIGDGPVQTFDEPDPPAFIINCVPSQQVITVTAQVVDDQGNESEEKEFEVVLDPDPSCTAG